MVLAEGRILLRLATEVTEIDNTTGQPVFGTFVPGLLTRKNETTVEIPSADPSPPPDFSRRSQSKPSMVFRVSSICRFSARCFARAITRSRKPNS